jgi:hypothetical protein
MTEGLGEILKRLHSELSGQPRLDPGTVESLRVLAADIERALAAQPHASNTAGTESAPIAEGSLSSRVASVLEDFEAHHPQLTKTLSMIAERLADMGI